MCRSKDENNRIKERKFFFSIIIADYLFALECPLNLDNLSEKKKKKKKEEKRTAILSSPPPLPPPFSVSPLTAL